MTHELKVERVLNAPAVEVFDAFTSQTARLPRA